VNLDLDDAQTALRASIGDLLAKECRPEVVRAAEPTGFDPALWRRFADLGLASIAVPESAGGGGAGHLELALVAELAGRALAPVPLVEAAVATTLLAALAPGSELLAETLDGRLVPTLALRPLTGEVAPLVPAGAVAGVVVLRRGDEILAVRPGRPRTPPANLGAMPVADCRPADGDTTVLARGAAAVAGYGRAVRRWEALTAAALAGLGSRALELAVEYVRQRRAFGTPIGAFQAVQHRLADDATSLEGARLIALKAAWAQDAATPDAAELATMALLFAARTAVTTASDAVHVHGGYGYTLEYDIQLYFRRAKAWALVAGDRCRAYADVTHRLYDGPGE
jgi:alkylation response protein AidB-like acyl-CoA dehydrogenase